MLKLTTLLAILSSKRASELTYLDIRHIVFKENSVVFHFSNLTKTWRKSKSRPSFELKGFEKEELCVIRCLKLSVDHRSFKESKNNTAFHQLYNST